MRDTPSPAGRIAAPPPATPRALPLQDAAGAAATLGGPAEASRHAALRRVPHGPAGGLRLARALR
ncbi:hypothetical protein [Roseomonas haemaphysalidis]|uniref:Uncharacterized protein n=1 Tax=Roseomonas haemaphysalidis TaxID=2768162 RepID=A0ABS3KNZ5_9PROT|nr:hypothetical protein [Roseomonas haemaphysalidis]MBO1079178.1 hypothetical protein [Roseomonas haemaphysalidis]